MPSSWSPKRERQYEHIKDSARKSGKSAKRAKEIAAATVNKQRRQKGETAGTKARRSKGGSTSRRSQTGSVSRSSRSRRTTSSTRRRKEARR